MFAETINYKRIRCKRVIFLFLIFNLINIKFFTSNAQSYLIKNKKISITESIYSDTLILGGKLDGFNTLSAVIYEGGADPYYAGYSRNFEPMKSIIITNDGDRKIIAPRLSINNQRQWFDLESWTNEIFRSSETDKEKLLSLWYYLLNNRVHYSPPSYDGYNVFNMFPIYGYGTCDIVSINAVKALNYIGYIADNIYVPHHVISNVTLENGDQCIIDGDKEVFYLKQDNSSLAGFQDVINDKYLIERTKHFGRATPYEKSRDRDASVIYYEKDLIKDLLTKKRQPTYEIYNHNALLIFKDKTLSYDFCLRPGESIHYSWDDTKIYSQEWDSLNIIPDLILKNIIANGRYIYNTSFINTIPNEMFFDYKNIGVGDATDVTPNIYPTGDSSYVTIAIESPFPILDAYVKGLFFLNSENDSIEVLMSLDNKYWYDKLLIKGIGGQIDSINLQNNLKFPIDDETKLSIAYKYYLRIIMHPSDINYPCGIDSIYIDNTFQVSRFFLPSLSIGKNTLTYTDSSIINDRKVDIDISWQESSDNTPPFSATEPLFPTDGMTVDSLYFGFEWNPFVDPDGDEIVDYEFLLSDRADAKYPLSPNFNLYISSFGKGIAPFYKVLETGWLNDGTTYYWKVRAKDTRGAWSEWSPVWSFTPHGVMVPVNLSVNMESDTVFLRWQRNPKGKKPDSYLIYGSNETNGFIPDRSNQIEVVYDTVFTVVYKGDQIPFSFYRVVACTDDGQISGPSDYDSIPGFNLFYTPNVIIPDELFTIDLAVNEKYTPFFYYGYDTIYFTPDITIVDFPAWLTPTGEKNLSGFVDYSLARKMIFNDTLTKVVVKIIYNDKNEKLDTIEIKKILKNRSPSPYLSNNIGYVENDYSAIFSTDDGDILYGDHNYIEILQIPRWLTYTIINDTLFLSGTPDSYFTNENYLKVKITDTKGESVEKVFTIKIYNLYSSILRVAPNPVNENFLILLDIKEESELTVSLISLSGKIIQIIDQNNYEKGVYQIPFLNTKLSPGIYILIAEIRNNKTKNTSSYFEKVIKY